MALEALDAFGLADQAGWPVGVLPYGDKKRVEMARAFVSQPVLTLLDEPVAGLNPEETATVAAFIRQMRLAGKTMILVEHDMELVMEVSDHVVVLDGGRRIAQGTPDAVRHNPLVIEAYLGRMSATAWRLGKGAGRCHGRQKSCQSSPFAPGAAWPNRGKIVAAAPHLIAGARK